MRIVLNQFCVNVLVISVTSRSRDISNILHCEPWAKYFISMKFLKVYA